MTKLLIENHAKRHKGQTLLQNARILDPESSYDQLGNLLIENGKIIDFGKLAAPTDAIVVDCGGKLLIPGLVDLEVHAREPGKEKKETINSASKSAVAGGVTTIAVTPDTRPVTDNLATLEFIQRRAREKALCNVEVFASITKNMEGAELTEIASLKEAGAIGISENLHSIMNSGLMRNAMLMAANHGVLLCHHVEDSTIVKNPVMNEGEVSSRLGLRGSPNIAESIIIERDLQLLELVQKDYPNTHYHILNISTAEALTALKRGKEKGLNVTAQTAPHYFTLTDEAVADYRTFAKVSPPLRHETDRKAIYEAVASGLIDAITSSHTPEDTEAKRVTFAESTFGMVGLETLLPLSLKLYYDGKISLKNLLARLTYLPANIISSKAGRIKKGLSADLALVDLDMSWEIDPNQFQSKSKNSPFGGYKVKGRALKTWVGGNLVYEL